MYAALAPVYDALAYDFDYDAWTQKYLELLLQKNESIKEICDCGCGTGEIAVRLAKKGFKVTGIDLSGDMLGVASDKARKAGVKIPFIRQDMRHLTLPHKQDAIICACDGVNYLTSDRAAEEFFASAYKALKPGGALAFDISNRAKLLKLASDGQYFEDDEERTYIWQNTFDENKQVLRMEICFFLRQEDGRYIKTRETHLQRAYKAQEIEAMLKKSGFESISVFGSDADMGEGADKNRVYFAAVKPKEGI